MPPPTEAIFKALDQEDTSELQAMLGEDPGLVHARHPNPDLYHWTTLQFAAARGRLAACKLLVDKGAEVYTNPNNTYPPVMQAAWGNHQEVVDYFLEEIPDKADGTNKLGITLNLAAREGWIDIVKKHLEADPLAVHQRGWIGDTCMHWPCHNNFADIVVLLLDAGADIEADEINWIGGKPLHWASEHAPNCVEVLLRRGADVNSRNNMPGTKFFGMTPLIMNATQKDDCAEVCELLLDAGADIKATDEAGKTALDWAKATKAPRICKMLEARLS